MAEILKGSAYERWEVPAMDEELALKKQQEEAAQQAMEEAEEEEAVQLPTAEEIAAIHQQAHDEGFAEGHAMGLKAAEIEAKNTLDEELAKLEEQRAQLQQEREAVEAERAELGVQAGEIAELLDAITHPLDELDETVEEQLLQLVIAVAKQLVRRELKSDPGEIVAIIREALGILPVGRREIQIYLNPQDLELVKSTLSLAEDDQRSWQLLEEPTISRGGCRLVSNDSQIDATVEKRLTAVATKLLGGERGNEQA